LKHVLATTYNQFKNINDKRAKIDLMGKQVQ
jgi:hypothetical protein